MLAVVFRKIILVKILSLFIVVTKVLLIFLLLLLKYYQYLFIVTPPATSTGYQATVTFVKDAGSGL